MVSEYFLGGAPFAENSEFSFGVKCAGGRCSRRICRPVRMISTIRNMFRKCCQPSHAGSPMGADSGCLGCPSYWAMNCWTGSSVRRPRAASTATRASRTTEATVTSRRRRDEEVSAVVPAEASPVAGDVVVEGFVADGGVVAPAAAACGAACWPPMRCFGAAEAGRASAGDDAVVADAAAVGPASGVDAGACGTAGRLSGVYPFMR